MIISAGLTKIRRKKIKIKIKDGIIKQGFQMSQKRSGFFGGGGGVCVGVVVFSEAEKGIDKRRKSD